MIYVQKGIMSRGALLYVSLLLLAGFALAAQASRRTKYPVVPVTTRGTLKPVQNTVPIQSLSELQDGVYVIERGRGCELQSKRTGVCV